MSHFYGTLQGNRGCATRCGTKASGITVQAAGWDGAVETNVWYDEKNDRNMVEVTFIRWHGAGTQAPIYCGPIDGSVKEGGGLWR